MKNFWHIFATIGLAVLTSVTPDLTQAIIAHPKVVTGLAAAWSILGNLLKSPVAPLLEKQ